jgi:hypothetical protein
MAKKGIFKKIIKGALIVGGSILGLGAGVGAIKGVVKGTGALAGIGKGVGGIRNTADKLKEGAVRVITGTTKVEREQIQAVKAEAKKAQDQLDQIQRLVNAGATPEEARATVGMAETELTSFEGEKLNKAGMFDFLQNKSVMYIAGALLLLFLVPKLLKSR